MLEVQEDKIKFHSIQSFIFDFDSWRPKGVEGYFAKNMGPRVEPTWAGMLDPPPTDQTGTGPLGRAALHRDDSTLISQFIKLEMKEPTQEQS